VVSTPLSAGDIVGRAFRIFRQNILFIGKILLLPTVFLCLGRIGVLVGCSYGAKFLNNPGAGILWFGIAFLGGIVFCFGAFMMWIRQLAIIRFLTGFAPSYEEAQRLVKGRIYSLIALTITTFMVSLVSTVVWAVLMAISVPALKSQGLLPILASFGLATGILGLIISLVFICMVNYLVTTALALENKDLGVLIGECFTLTLHSFFRSIVFFVLSLTSVMVVAYPMSLPMLLLIGAFMLVQGAATGNPETALPMYMQVLNSVWETAINMVIGPIYYLSYALYYSDLCMRQHGIDLIERLDGVEAAEGAGRLHSHGS